MPQHKSEDTNEETYDRELIEKVAAAIVARGMTTPAIFLLESSKPLSFLGSQALHFLEPFVRSLLDAPSYTRFAKALEDRENVERLLVRIEALDEEARRGTRAASAAARAAKAAGRVAREARDAEKRARRAAERPNG